MLKRSLLAMLLISSPAFADAPVIRDVVAKQSDGLWRFDVTLAHGDTGWDHYADGWRVLDQDGNVLGVRNLSHPHKNEQPFTRSLSGLKISQDVTEVGIQARDNVDGWASEITKVKLR